MSTQVKTIFLSIDPLEGGNASVGKCSEGGLNQILASGEWCVQHAHFIERDKHGKSGWQCLLVREVPSSKTVHRNTMSVDELVDVKRGIPSELLFAGTVPIPNEEGTENTPGE